MRKHLNVEKMIVTRFFTTILILNAAVQIYSMDENYCDPSLCDDGTEHIACDHYLEFAHECGDEPELIPLNAKEKKFILELHNQYRNKVALGKFDGYPTAERMPTVRWNDGLAYVASLQVRSCSIDSDQCRNTNSFRNSGQNIGFEILEDKVHNVTGHIKVIMEGWMAESEFGNEDSIKMINEDDL